MWPPPATKIRVQKKLIILTTAFGNNFSGGSRATCEVISQIQDEFSQIIVLGTKLGNHDINALQFIKLRNWFHAYDQVNKLNSETSVFYGDFYNAIILSIAQVKYVFTYHDNWPELSKLNTRHFIQNLFYSPIYRQIFKHAKRLITVSQFKRKQLESYGNGVELIPNGIAHPDPTSIQYESAVNKPRKALMVGNIDQRKYAKALLLFKEMTHPVNFEVDVYGHIVDKRLANKLKQFQFVNLKGFVSNVPFTSYRLLLHTSFTESFGMIFCEAISHGVPVLAFEGGGASEIVVEENGHLVPKNDIELLQEKVNTMVNSPFLANPSSVKKYSWTTTSGRYKKIFQNV